MVPSFPEHVGKSLSLVSSIPRPTERFFVILLFGVLCLTFGGRANAVRGANNKLFVFHGKIQALDTAARTFTLQADKQSYVFVITDQTKIIRNGKAQQFADLKPGQPAEVEMQIGAGGKGVAVSVRLGFDSRQLHSPVQTSQLLSLFAATTPDGKTISGAEMGRVVVHMPNFGVRGPWPFAPLKPAVFLLSVRSDGTVSNVEMLNSTGYDKVDKWATEWATQWRFRPNSVVQARVAIQLGKLSK
jgi:TonB family protein